MSANLTPTYNGSIPAFPQALYVDVEYLDIPVVIDLSISLMQGKINGVQTVFIDAINSETDIELKMLDTKQRIVAKAKTQGYYPVLTSQLMKFETKSSAPANYSIIFINFPIAAGAWGQSGGGISELPIATPAELGAIKVGDTLEISADGVLNTAPYELPIATNTELGAVRIGEGLQINAEGYLSATGGGGGGTGGTSQHFARINFYTNDSVNIPSNATTIQYLNFNTLGMEFYELISPDSTVTLGNGNPVLFSTNREGHYRCDFSITTEVTEGANCVSLGLYNAVDDEIYQSFEASYDTSNGYNTAVSNKSGKRTGTIFFNAPSSECDFVFKLQNSINPTTEINGFLIITPMYLIGPNPE